MANRQADMPKPYRSTYNRAMGGKSLRAAIRSFCLECVCWQREEVRRCPSYPCPLWPYRPYQENPKTPTECGDSAPESTNGIGRTL